MQATNISINPLESFSLVEVTDLLQQLTEVMKAEIEFLENESAGNQPSAKQKA